MGLTFGRMLIENMGGLEPTVASLKAALESLYVVPSKNKGSRLAKLLGRETDRFYVLDFAPFGGANTSAMDVLARMLPLHGGRHAVIVLCIDSDIMWVQLNGPGGISAFEIGPIREKDFGGHVPPDPNLWRGLLTTDAQLDALEALRCAEYARAEDALGPLSALLGFDPDLLRHGEGAVLWEALFQRQ